MNKKEFALLLGFVFTVAFSLCCESISAAENIKANILRLHVIANSDTVQDRDIKLAVKDEILKMENLLPDTAADYSTALETVNRNTAEIADRINTCLAQWNVPYKAECAVERFYFDTTEYDSFALPQGEYTALTVRLGRAQGKNWWCVVYPALCSQSCGKIVLENSDEFIKTDSITARFKVVEIYEDIKGYFSQRADRYEHL
ncbi:MAG: stage II sporulation protein R [Oscillospiraceae bacterium]|nr:stage II sporulation protein R [Oscillospiraceae bacterium]